MSQQINQEEANAQLEKLKETEKHTTKQPIIQAIQQNMDDSAEEMAAIQNAEDQKQKQELEELSDNVDLAMARANQAQAEYKEMNDALQMNLWKSFPSPHLHYYIKAPSGLLNGIMVYLYADNSDNLRSSGNQPIPSAGSFRFTRNSDGSFSIYSMAKEKYLQIDASALISQVTFSASDCSINTKFVLTLYQQDLQPGLLMDIRSLVDDDC